MFGQSPSDFQALVLSIAFYAFSFLILISVWYSYTRTMALLRVETDMLVSFNVLLLFLVSIEPFLFNQLINSSMSLVENASIVYAFDLGGLFAIQALFFISTLPIFWNWTIQVDSNFGIPLRVILWVLTLFMPSIRRFWEKRVK
ncbi:MAG: TMEM175 family protein [Candidatus Bathyarchaeales archaeon]